MLYSKRVPNLRRVGKNEFDKTKGTRDKQKVKIEATKVESEREWWGREGVGESKREGGGESKR